MDVLMPDPLTFMLRLTGHDVESEKPDPDKESNIGESSASKGSVIAHEIKPMEVLVRTNTKDMIKINFNITCRDVAGENCVDETKATVLWTAAAVIDNPSDILRARAKATSPSEPIFCRRPPYRVRVHETA
ncbi:hypothetical protein S83_019750 [Arachis hypogaea]